VIQISDIGYQISGSGACVPESLAEGQISGVRQISEIRYRISGSNACAAKSVAEFSLRL
jgi:hypothetical protein